MNLSDDEITLIVRECARGSAINRDGSTSHRIARAIESAVLAKLREQEPIAIVGELSEPSRSDVINNKGLVIGQYLYPHPAPIPEAPLESIVRLLNKAFDYDGDVFGILHNEATDTLSECEAMLAAARSE